MKKSGIRKMFVVVMIVMITFAMPFTFFAQDVEDNPVGTTLDALGNGAVMDVNYGTVRNNNGTINTNEADAIIENNYSIVMVNKGTIINNYSINVIDNSNGSIINNYLMKDGNWGVKNNYYIISDDRLIEGLDWTLNPENFTSDLYLYVGAPSNEEGLRGATFKAAEGYKITLNQTTGNGFQVTDNGDGTYSIAIDADYRSAEIDLASVLSLEKRVSISVNASPTEGGVIIDSAKDVEFVSGYYSLNESFFLEAKPNEGYRFVGWEIPSDDNRVEITEDNMLFINSSSREGYYAPSISCVAVFEKIEDTAPPQDTSPDGSGASTAPSQDTTPDGSGTSTEPSSNLVPNTGDNTPLSIFVVLLTGSMLTLVVTVVRYYKEGLKVR